MCCAEPPRVIHIVENLDRGAVENWLVRMLRHARLKGVKMDWTFYCAVGQQGKLDEEALRLGAKVIKSPVPMRKKLSFIRALRKELKRGAYDILHCHHDLISGVYFAAAVGVPLRGRLVHVHNADEAVLTPRRWKQALLRPVLRQACLSLADKVVAVSNHTLDSFLAGRQRRAKRDIVHYYGVDSRPFISVQADPVGFRRGLNLPQDVRILLFAGRMVPEKNPTFVVDVVAELKRSEGNVAAIFVGVGSEESATVKRAEQLGVSDSIRMLGWREDIAEIMICCDWFILPRPEERIEGFGLAVVEAQLAGLMLLLSNGISNDPLLSSACFARLALDEGPAAWAHAALELIKQQPIRQDAISALKQSPLDMTFAARDLQGLHVCSDWMR